jgi:hypothetical protein
MEMNSQCNLRVSFLTWNIYQGFDVTPLFAASPEQIPEVVTQVFRQFLATNFPVRAKAIAEAIASEKPDFIGLQEAVRVELIIPTFRTVTYDFIEILLEALDERRMKYEIITEAQVNTLMDLVIAKNVFATVYGNLTGKKDAKIVYADTNEVVVA